LIPTLLCYSLIITDSNHDQHCFLILKVVLFIRKLTEILDHCPKCEGKYQLVPLSKTETNKIADILVRIQ